MSLLLPSRQSPQWCPGRMTTKRKRRPRWNRRRTKTKATTPGTEAIEDPRKDAKDKKDEAGTETATVTAPIPCTRCGLRYRSPHASAPDTSPEAQHGTLVQT